MYFLNSILFRKLKQYIQMILGYQNFSCLSLIYSRFFFRHVDDGEIQQVFHPIFLAYRMLNTVYILDSKILLSYSHFRYTHDGQILVTSPSGTERFSARLVTFFHSARNPNEISVSSNLPQVNLFMTDFCLLPLKWVKSNKQRHIIELIRCRHPSFNAVFWDSEKPC